MSGRARSLDRANGSHRSGDTLVYLLAYKDGTARDAAWAAFQADPEWVKTRTEMQVNVQVDNVFMSATDYSPMK